MYKTNHRQGKGKKLNTHFKKSRSTYPTLKLDKIGNTRLLFFFCLFGTVNNFYFLKIINNLIKVKCFDENHKF